MYKERVMNRLFALCMLTLLTFIFSVSLTVNAPAAVASHQTVAIGNTDAGFDLYRELGAKGGNLFFSPYSISSALGMTYAGARNETALQMRETLHFQLEQAGLNSAFKSLNQKLLLTAENSGQKLAIANALVLTKGKVSNNYMDILKKYYNAEIFGGDLSAINNWVTKKTEGKINKILDQLSANSVCVILNAIYFKGIWDVQFDKKDTNDAPFYQSPGTEMKVPLMHRKDMYKLLDEKEMQVISLPYKGKALSMIVVLPRNKDGLTSIENNFNAAFLQDLVKRLDKTAEQKVSVYFPKFKMETGYDLAGLYARLGMKDAFSPAADFSGMGWPKGYLWIGQIKHKACVEVNEEGTEAAAATAVEMVTKSAAPTEIVFRADHPFFFLIRDNETGTVLFMGRIVKP